MSALSPELLALKASAWPAVPAMREALLDANILLRYLTDVPRDLADRVAGILERAEDSGTDLVVAPLIFAEVIYVLQSVYGWSRVDIA